jgi:hypothetical protein
MRFTRKGLIEAHDKLLKKRYGADCLTRKDFHVNYGWSQGDHSICSKVYRKTGNHFVHTSYDALNREYVGCTGKL